jgi:hypothetical protein
VRQLLVSAIVAFGLLAGATTPAFAAPCKDAKGKFIKCPTVKKAPVRCKDSKGKFIKCGSPGAKPM